jgi:hypothetical protein
MEQQDETMPPNFVHEKSASDFTIQDEQTLELIAQYLAQLTPLQQKAIKIAKMHLGSSFNILKSNGFNDWIHCSREA